MNMAEIRPVMMYVAEVATMMKADEEKLNVVVRKMLVNNKKYIRSSKVTESNCIVRGSQNNTK